MNRPLPLRVLPPRLRASLASRHYYRRRSHWTGLYEDARLAYAPGVRMKLVPADCVSDAIAFAGFYELPMTRRVARLAQSGGLLVDVGANLGYYTLLWAAARPDNRVIAIEASPRNVDLLRENVARNGLGDRVRVLPHAAGREPGRMRFDPGKDGQHGWGGLAAGGSVEVEVVRVDDVVPAGAEVALLKIDTEGADAWVIEGCAGLLRERRVREVWFEQAVRRAQRLGIPETAGADFLRGAGYAVRPVCRLTDGAAEWVATPA